MKILTPKIHGFLDYAVILVLFFAPSVLKFPPEPARISYALGIAYVILTLFTAYPVSLSKLIPFTVHGAIELILSPVLVLLPWIAGFSYDPPARYFYVIAGLALFVVWLLTDYKAADIAYGKKGLDIGQRGGGTRGVTA